MSEPHKWTGSKGRTDCWCEHGEDHEEGPLDLYQRKHEINEFHRMEVPEVTDSTEVDVVCKHCGHNASQHTSGAAAMCTFEDCWCLWTPAELKSQAELAQEIPLLDQLTELGRKFGPLAVADEAVRLAPKEEFVPRNRHTHEMAMAREQVFVEVIFGLTCLAHALHELHHEKGARAAVQYVEKLKEWEA